MACPFRHLEDTEPPPEKRRAPRGPLERIIDWYVRDINISRQIGWKHGPPPDKFIRLYEYVDSLLSVFYSEDARDAMDMGMRFEEILERLPPEAPRGTFPPLLNKALWLPERPLAGHPKVPPLGRKEEAFTTILDEERFGAWLPAGRGSKGEGHRRPTTPIGQGRDEGRRSGRSSGRTGGRSIGSKGQGRRMKGGGAWQTNWSEIIGEMQDLVGAPELGGPSDPEAWLGGEGGPE